MNFVVKGWDKLKQVFGNFFKATAKHPANFRQTMGEESDRLETILQNNAPKRTGQYAAGIHTTLTGTDENLKITITDPQPLGSYIRFGTRPHPIYPVRAKMLRFTVGGRVVFARKVNHPGTKANPFMIHSIGEWETGATQSLNKVASQYVEVANGGD